MRRYTLPLASLLLLIVPSAPLAAPRRLTRARPAAIRARSGPADRLDALRAELRALRERIPLVDATAAQVKDLHLRLLRLAARLDRLERAAAAPADLARKVAALSEAVRDLGQAVERVRLARVRAAARAAEPARSTAGIRAGYDGGFFLASRDGRYRIVANGVLRTWFRLGQATGGETVAPPPRGPVDLASLGVPNGLLMVSGNVFTKALTYHVEADIGGEGFTLWDFWFDYRPCAYFGVTAGQFSLGYAHQQVLDPYDILFPDSSAAALLFGVGRDIGVKLHFHQWQDRVFEELAVFNGGGMNTLENDNLDFLYLARAGITPLGPVPGEEGDLRAGARPLRLLVALGYFFVPMPTGEDLDRRDGMDNSFVHQAAAELRLVVRGVALAGEFYYRYEDRGAAVTQRNPAEARRLHRFGGYGQVSYFVRRIGLALGARYGYAQPVSFWHRKAGARQAGWSSPLALPDTATGALPEAVHEAAATAAYYAFGKHLKVVAGYTFFYEQGYSVGTAKASRQVHLATLLAQARF